MTAGRISTWRMKNLGMIAVAGEVAPEEEEGHVAADERDRLHDREGDPDAGARDEVVGERVAEEAVENGEDEHRRADDPVQLPGPAERPGEEHTEHVDDDRTDEDVRRPVVHLAHEQAAADREADVHRGGEGLGDGLAPKRGVRAVVDDRLCRTGRSRG